jgi:hypothetical protein
LKTKWTKKQILLYVQVEVREKNESFRAGRRQLGRFCGCDPFMVIHAAPFLL